MEDVKRRYAAEADDVPVAPVSPLDSAATKTVQVEVEPVKSEEKDLEAGIRS